jgi:NADH:ubiquinone oxidoreductase subunit E
VKINGSSTALLDRDIDAVLENREGDGSQLVEVLLDIQEKYKYLPEDMLREVSRRLNLPLIEVFRVANFYRAFSLSPQGEHLLTVCLGTACHVRGAPKLIDEACRILNIAPGDTTNDGKFTLETVHCLGACALSPVAIIDGKYYEHVTPGKLRSIIGSFSQERLES